MVDITTIISNHNVEAGHLTALDGVPRRVLLWLDPHAELACLLAHLEPTLPTG
jgi:hypothetical protein